MKTQTALCLFVLLVSACVPQLKDPAEALTSGVKGQALIGPMCPIMQEGVECPDQPYQITLSVIDLDGQKVARFDTDAEGKFQINLPPGDYILHPDLPAGRPIPSAADVAFTVLPNEFTNIIVTFDSGIR
jgi:hypothetical protein